MKAWQFLGPQQPLALVEIDEPVPREREVVLDVRAVGLCHSDVSIIEGTLLNLKTPIVLGHEVAGVVSGVGPGVTEVKIGDRVGLAYAGMDDTPGVSRDGGFALKTIGTVGNMVPIPQDVSFEQAAVGTDAGMTSHHAVRLLGDLGPGARVGIVGLGGLGLVGARIAVIYGAKVFAAEPKRQVWSRALDLGITQCFTDVCEFASLDLDAIIDFAGVGHTTAGAIAAVRPGGRVVLVGLASAHATIDTHALVQKQVHLIGSLGGTREDIAAVYALIASGQLSPPITVIHFDEIPQALERLKQGEVDGRLVARVSG